MMHPVAINIALLLDTFARAGGGGSGGGGSGGSGGGGAIAVIGYGIGYIVTKFIKRLLPPGVAYRVSIVATSILTLMGVAGVVWVAIVDPDDAFAAMLVMTMIIIGLWIGWHSAYYQWWEKSAGLMKRALGAMLMAAQKDPTWNPERLKQYASDVFVQFQKDWSTFDIDSMQRYMMPAYRDHMTLVLQAMHDMGRRNEVRAPQIIRIEPVHALDFADDEKDMFHMAIEAKTEDMLIDETTGDELFRDTRAFTEVWKFEREGSGWLLTGIDQSTADEGTREREIQKLAEQNGMFYSLDWGWLLLPERGVLFSKGEFGNSDINNHVIGVFEGILTQVYTYVPDPGAKQGAQQRYLIGQINLPKSYGNIIVRSHKTGKWNILDKLVRRQYEEYSMEWPDFNERYQVLATDPDRLATFELVNPGFMAYVYDLDAAISIEVVGSIVYFYTSGMTSAVTYQRFLGLLTRAHKELKL